MNIKIKDEFKKILTKTRLITAALLFVKVFNVNIYMVFFRPIKFYLYNNLLTHLPNHFIRQLYLKYFLGVKIGESSFIHMGCRFEGKNISIGNNSVVGRSCILNGNITIKNNVSITAETYIFTSSHIADSPIFEGSYGFVVIEDYAWIGARAMILPNVIIGRGAILGAASTATKNIPAYSIFAGSPAKAVGKRSELLEYKLNYSPFFQ